MCRRVLKNCFCRRRQSPSHWRSSSSLIPTRYSQLRILSIRFRDTRTAIRSARSGHAISLTPIERSSRHSPLPCRRAQQCSCDLSRVRIECPQPILVAEGLQLNIVSAALVLRPEGTREAPLTICATCDLRYGIEDAGISKVLGRCEGSKIKAAHPCLRKFSHAAHAIR